MDFLENEADFLKWAKYKFNAQIGPPQEYPCYVYLTHAVRDDFLQGLGGVRCQYEYLYEAELSNMLLALHRAQNTKG